MKVADAPSSMLSKIVWLEPIWLLALGPLLLFPGRFGSVDGNAIWIAGLFLFWPIRWVVWWRGEKENRSGRIARLWMPPQTPLSITLLLLLLWLPVTFWASAYPDRSWAALGALVYGIVLYVALCNWQLARRYPEIIVLGILAVGFSLALVSPFMVRIKPEFRLFYLALYAKVEALSASRGETIHANVLAGAMVLIFPLTLSIGIGTVDRGRAQVGEIRLSPGLRLAALLGSMLILVIIVLTQSRAAYLAVGVALLVLVLLRWPKSLWALVPLGILTILLMNRSNPIGLLDALSMDGSLGGWSGRVDIWRNSLIAMDDFRLTGIGIGTFADVLPQLYPLGTSIEGYPHAHNHLLQVALDLGLPGLIAYVALVAATFVMALALHFGRASLSPLLSALVIGSIAALIAMFVHGQFDAVLWGTKLAFLPWLLFALLAAIYRPATLAKTSTDVGTNPLGHSIESVSR